MPDDIAQWLDELGLGKYARVFAENDIDWRALPALSEDDLKGLGLSLGHRRVLQRAVVALAVSTPASPFSRSQADGVAVSEPHNLAAWERHPGERKPVTMLFADVTGSTALTEHLDAEETHEVLYGATRRMCEAVEHYGGTVCRFMGDGVMAMFGAPMANEHHAAHACAAALHMQRAIAEYAGAQKGGLESRLRIRVGLHSGEVVVLTVGDGGRTEYDASGPTVPIAARLEQAAQPGEVYLSAATAALAARRIKTEARQVVRVKGISEPLRVFVLRGLRTVEEALADVAHTPFVGRKSELNQFRGILQTCIEQAQGQSVYVRGEPGIGKTRLVGEFAALASAAGALVHRGLVLPFGVGKGQGAVRALVRSLLQIPPGAGKAFRAHALAHALDGGWLEPEQQMFLDDLLDLPQTTAQRSIFDAMDNTARNAGKQTVVSALIQHMSGHRPVLLIVEDVHWADEVTLAQLANMAMTVRDCAALLIMTSRVEGDPLGRQWLAGIAGSPFATIDLGALRRQESVTLIGEFIDRADPLVERCIARAGGNPLFLEQLLRTARESASLELPDSIQSLVLARLDRLDLQHKRALQTASVIGQRFNMALLRHLLQQQNYDCQVLIDHNLVRPEGAGYLFGHALIQEGVYSSLLNSQRRELHLKAAQWFEGQDKTLRAQHLDKANDEHAGLAYLDAASEQASQYRYEAALGLTERGLELSPRGLQRHRLTCFKAELLLDLSDTAASTSAYKAAQAHAADDSARLDAWMGLAACMRITTDYEGALELLAKCEPLARNLNSKLQLSRLYHLRGNIYFPLGKVDACREAHQLALEYAKEAGSAEDEARALGGLGDAEYARGRMKSAVAALQMCIDKCDENGFGRIAVANLSQIANGKIFLGGCAHNLELSLNAVRSAARVSHRRAEMNAHASVCSTAFELGDVAQLKHSAERGLKLAKMLKARNWEPLWHGYLAQVSYLQGDLARGCEAINQALQYQSALSFVGCWLYGLLCMMAEAADTRRQALAAGERLLEQGSMGENILHFYRLAIEGCLNAGQWQEAEKFAARLANYTRSEPLPWSDFFIARGRALAAFGTGRRDASVVGILRELCVAAERHQFNIALPALRDALKRV